MVESTWPNNNDKLTIPLIPPPRPGTIVAVDAKDVWTNGVENIIVMAGPSLKYVRIGGSRRNS